VYRLGPYRDPDLGPGVYRQTVERRRLEGHNERRRRGVDDNFDPEDRPFVQDAVDPSGQGVYRVDGGRFAGWEQRDAGGMDADGDRGPDAGDVCVRVRA
jgi:hypothetical protein